ncbi:interleukin-31 [Meriones unguiculatus]|uniref:interleukin-31 n=1 Tax=Meriones unguiculatus TaxID=10047 RepID=UPI000B4EB578|nr:interleukin-31 [Meriones unguiculatus]
MIFHIGPTKPALVVLCCIGTWLAICSLSFGAPTPDQIKTILEILRHDSKQLYEDYIKREGGGVFENESLQLPCFTLGRGASANISVLKAYLEKVKVVDQDRTNTYNVTKRLEDISCTTPLELNIPGPDTSKFYECKSFILTVLKQFADCMAKLEFKNSVC